MRKRKTIRSLWSDHNLKVTEKKLTLAHPVVRASYLWSILSEQLLDVLGPEIHHRWFREACPLVISDSVLLLEVPNHFSAQWIHTHYLELIDVLLSVQDKELSAFFVSRSERIREGRPVKMILEESAAEIDRGREDQDSRS